MKNCIQIFGNYLFIENTKKHLESHEMIKKHNKKLETDLAKLKSKYEEEIAQMRASHTQLKSLFMKNSF